MGFRLEYQDEEESEETKQNEQQNKQSTELTEQQKETAKAQARLFEVQEELAERRREHKKALNTIRAQTFGLYLLVLKSFPCKSFTATELWLTLRLFLTNKNSKFRIIDRYLITEEEFYGIFGHYPMTMANNRLYKITFLLKQRPDIEWLQDGRVLKYRYIGAKKSEPIT